jgi:hypothetical protein
MFVSVRAALGLLVVAVLVAVAAPAAAVEREQLLSEPSASRPVLPGRGIVLVFFDVHGLMPRGFAESATEVETIFRDADVEISWRAAGPGATYGDNPWPELPVILLPEDPLRSRRSRNVMGLVVRGHQTPFPIWTFLEPIRTVLGLPRENSLLLPAERTRLARAVGRVVAHEMIHVLAPEHPHDRHGLMRHALDRGSLIGEQAALAGRCARAVQSGLAALWSHRAAAFASAPSDATPLVSSDATPVLEAIQHIGPGISIEGLLPNR